MTWFDGAGNGSAGSDGAQPYSLHISGGDDSKCTQLAEFGNRPLTHASHGSLPYSHGLPYP